MNANKASGQNNGNQEEFGPGNRTTHNKNKSPYAKEFSKLLKKVPEKLLFEELSPPRQRQLAQSLWEACNYGGHPKPGQFKDMEPKREYLEWVLRMDHQDQWDKTHKRRYSAGN